MKKDFFIFGFEKSNSELLRFKRQFFKLVEGYFEHLRVSIQFGVTKKSTILRNYLEGTRRYLYAQGYSFKETNEIIRKLKKLSKLIYEQLSRFELLGSLSEYEFHNATPLSLFALVKRCEKPVISSVIVTRKNASVA